MSRFLTCLILGALLLIAYAAFNTFTVPTWHRGEFGADLRLLRSYYAAPQNPGESNFVIDMLRNGHFGEFLKIQGLTNNQALFVLSHGASISTRSALRYAYYPDDRVLTSARVPYFSARDLARIIGPREAKNIRNVILAGCNVEGAFDAGEIRKYFVNATNITHTPAGKNGYEFVLRHGLIYNSEGIRFFYQMPESFTVGEAAPPPSQRNAKLGPYVAELFEAEKSKPYKTQIAGRELLGAAPAQPLLTAKNSAGTVAQELSINLPDDRDLPERNAKPIILIRAGRNIAVQSISAGGFCPTIPLSVPTPWGKLVLNVMLALVFLRASLHWLRLAVR